MARADAAIVELKQYLKFIEEENTAHPEIGVPLSSDIINEIINRHLSGSYESIETVYVRNEETHRLSFGEIRAPETTFINRWTVSEKIDGTNMRATITLKGIDIQGRKNTSQASEKQIQAVLNALPSHAELVDYFTAYRDKRDEEGNIVPLDDTWSVTFYGECYGPGIQKGGGNYAPNVRFRVFDLLLGTSWWVDDFEMRVVCRELGIPTAPRLDTYFTRTTEFPQTREELLAVLPESIVAIQDNNKRGVLPEGIVVKPVVTMLNKHGERIMWKLTLREFK